jgi:hypothetical protein
LTKYYGLVPRHLLKQAQQETDAEEETVSLTGDEEDTSYYVMAKLVKKLKEAGL